MNNSRGYNTNSSRIDVTNRYAHLYDDEDSWKSKKNICKVIVIVLILLLVAIIMYFVLDSSSDAPPQPPGPVPPSPDTWKPEIVEPALGPYSSPLCEKYLNANHTSPNTTYLQTFKDDEDWTLTELWIYQENYHRS